MVLGLTRTNNRLITGYLCKAGENHVPWSPWATTLADDVSQLLPLDQRGPWQDNLACSQSSSVHDLAPAGSHPAEPPHFFYCRAHLEAIRRTHGTTRPWPARDQGRCVACGEPAERKPVIIVAPVACVVAERAGTTVARLMTYSRCRSCNPRSPDNLPWCRGRVCRETGRERRVQRRGCCGITRTGRRRHCADCCAAAAANLSAQVMPPATREAGAAAKRRGGDERRERIRDLRRGGLDNKAIADRLGVHVRTVQRALEGADNVATDQT